MIFFRSFVVSNVMKLDNPGSQRNDRLTKAESRISLFNDELKKTYEALSGGIKFKSFHDISTDQIGVLALAWSENRTSGRSGFTSSLVITRLSFLLSCNRLAIRWNLIFHGCSGMCGLRKIGRSGISMTWSGRNTKGI
jgi:hypothetical protein